MKLVKCERLDHFGRGIVYVDGKIVFVKNLLPFEEAYIQITKSKKNYSEGEILSLEKESKDRICPKCPYMNCGCAVKHLSYEKQLEFKEEKIKNIMNKYVHTNFKINKIVPSDDVLNYRNKITLKADGKLGYYEAGSNNIIHIDRCELASEKTNEIINFLNNMDLSKVKEIIIKDFEKIMLIVKGVLDIESLKPLVGSIYMEEKLVYGDEFIQTKIDDLTFNISKDAFFQVNNSSMKKLYDLAINYCGNDYDKKVLDLYCGTGTITLLLSKYFKEVVGIEINKSAVRCAEINKKLNGIKNVNFICGDVSKEIGKLRADIIVVDPPRSGLSKEGIKDILKISPEKIVYISCDPMTLARDLNILKDFYDIKEATSVDMFPNTFHVETVTLLERK